MRVAFLADIHGNLPAFEASLKDLKQQSPDAVFLGGDQINRCPWNNEVLDLINDLKWPAIQGNHELVVGVINTPSNWWPFTERHRFPILWWTQEHLRDEHLAAIRTLPESMHIRFEDTPPILLVHGVPGNPHVGFYPAISDEAAREALEGVCEPVVICGHTHRPMDRQVDAWRIINSGAVGLPYNGDARAQYVLLDLVQDAATPRWEPTFRQVDYDHTIIPTAYEESGLRMAGEPMSRLTLRTLMTGDPWTSDFGVWMRRQPRETANDMAGAIDRYLAQHGPGRWAFDE
jgi:predicted phosphodiesterase